MKIPFSSLPFIADRRGNKLQKFRVGPMTSASGDLLLLCGPEEIFSQITEISRGSCVKRELSDKGKKRWTHALHFADGVPQEIKALCNCFREWLTIPSPPHVDLCMSVDWYKESNEDGELIFTEMGRCINYTKYALYPNGSSSRKAREELLRGMSELIENHPLFMQSDYLTTPPGSKGNGNSFGEQLGEELAAITKKTYISTKGPARPEQKEESGRQARTDFTMLQPVRGKVLIIDDVLHTGSTIESTAFAARRAGATQVLALTAARTIRK